MLLLYISLLFLVVEHESRISFTVQQKKKTVFPCSLHTNIKWNEKKQHIINDSMFYSYQVADVMVKEKANSFSIFTRIGPNFKATSMEYWLVIYKYIYTLICDGEQIWSEEFWINNNNQMLQPNSEMSSKYNVCTLSASTIPLVKQK